MSTFVAIIFTLIVYGAIFALLWFIVNYVIANAPIPDPFGKWVRILLMVCAVFVVIDVLLQLVGGGGFLRVPLLRWQG
jgi:hypothetical protein